MVKPISLESYVSDLNKVDLFEAKYRLSTMSSMDVDRARKICKNQLIKNAALFHATGSDHFDNARVTLRSLGNDRKVSEKDFNPLQKLAYRIAGVFKRGTFGTKGESAIKTANKMDFIAKKMESKQTDIFITRLASLVDVDNIDYHFENIARRNFAPIFSHPKLPVEDVVKVVAKFDVIDAILGTSHVDSLLVEFAKNNPEPIIDAVMFSPAMRARLVGQIVQLDDTAFEKLAVKLFEIHESRTVGINTFISDIRRASSPSQIAILLSTSPKVDVSLF